MDPKPDLNSLNNIKSDIDLAKVTPPKDLSDAERETVFLHLFHRLASYRNTAAVYAELEAVVLGSTSDAESLKADFIEALNRWGEELVRIVWLACQEPGGGELYPYRV